MRTQDIITDEYVSKQAVAYSECASDHTCDWKSLKMAMVAAAEIAASAVGSPLEGSLMKDDGSWATASP